MRRLISIAALSVLAGSAAAQDAATTADPRAFEYCRAEHEAFTKVADCLPEAHVAILAMDAFRSIYPAEATSLADRCEELNDHNPVGAFDCVEYAIKDAISLAAQLPAGADMGDPVFDAIVANPDLLQQVLDVSKEARSIAPDGMIWGGNVYIPYR